jgi:hypothetical protein
MNSYFSINVAPDIFHLFSEEAQILHINALHESSSATQFTLAYLMCIIYFVLFWKESVLVLILLIQMLQR